MRRWEQALPPLLLLVLGGARLLRRESLWYDELFTAQVARVPLGELAGAVVNGTGTAPYLVDVPPSYNAPYYVVMHAWTAAFGTSEVALRLPSLLASVAAVAVVGALVARLADRRAALWAGVATALSPLVVDYAVEARAYGLAMLATSLAALGVARWLAGDRGLPLAAAAGTAAGLLHWFALPVLAGLGLAALVLRGRRGLTAATVLAAAALPALALVAVAVSSGRGGAGADFIRPVGLRLPVEAVDAWSGGSVVLAIAVVLLAVRGVVGGGRLRVVAGSWLGVPLVLLTAMDLALRPVFLPRYLLPALLGLAVLAGAGAARRGAARVPLAALLVVAGAVASVQVVVAGPREQARQAVAYALAQRGVVVAADPRAALALEHYAPGRAVLPPDDAPSNADEVWLVRRAPGGRLRASDDDALLQAAGLRVVSTRAFTGTSATLVVQHWSRPS